MRGVLLSFAFAAAVAIAAPSAAGAPAVGDHPLLIAAAQDAPNPTKDLNIDINLNRGGDGVRWYRSPVWIAIGAVAAVLVLLIVVLAARSGGGGGTTIVKD